jgi:hypothetical protein
MDFGESGHDLFHSTVSELASGVYEKYGKPVTKTDLSYVFIYVHV